MWPGAGDFEMHFSTVPKTHPATMEVIEMNEYYVQIPPLGWDGHGGHAEEHRAEMAEIAREVYAQECLRDMEKIEHMIQEKMYLAYEQAMQDVLRALEYDVQSVTRIGIDGCRDIFESKKAQKYISDQVMKTIKKELKGKHLKM